MVGIMIDPHVHLRDGDQTAKETVEHGLWVAQAAGLDAVFEMPNTSPSLVSERTIRDRIDLADLAKSHLAEREPSMPSIFHGLYAGLTVQPDQVKTVVRLHQQYFPRIVGLKMYAGSSTGNLGVLAKDEQQKVFEILASSGFRGVLAVHCEKEDLFDVAAWDPDNARSHGRVRPPEAEVESVRDMIALARQTGFPGHLHVCHISVPDSVDLLEREKRRGGIRLSCGVTPHHLLLCESDIGSGDRGFLLKINPPLRSETMRSGLVARLLSGKIDWIETDHAPHTLAEKTDCRGNRPSGFPGLPVYPRLLLWLRERGVDRARLDDLTHNRIEQVFGIELENTHRSGRLDLAAEYDVDAYEGVQSL
jgi:dihydroorotase